jgi:hypothetical protein
MNFTAYRWFSKTFSVIRQNLFSRINTCSASHCMHPHAGAELLTSIKDLSFNIKIYGTTLEDNFVKVLIVL